MEIDKNFPSEDRRRYPRYDVKYGATIFAGRREVACTVINISEIGIGVLIPAKLMTGEELELWIDFEFSSGEIRPFRCKTIVVWTETREYQGFFRSGLSIIDSSDEDLILLHELIQDLKSGNG